MRALVTLLAVSLVAVLLAGLGTYLWFTPASAEAGEPRPAPPSRTRAAAELSELAPAEPVSDPVAAEGEAEPSSDPRKVMAARVPPEPQGLEDGGQAPPIAPPGDPAQGEEEERTPLIPVRPSSVDLGSGRPTSTLTPEQAEALKRGEKPRR